MARLLCRYPPSSICGLSLQVALKGTPGLGYYGLMNEPYGLGTNVWRTTAQAAVNAIRLVDTSAPICVQATQGECNILASIANSNMGIGPYTDSANKLVYDLHLYFDNDGSGRYLQTYDQQGAYPNLGSDRVQFFLTWLKQNNAKGIIGEFGIPNNDPRWLPVLDNFLTTIQAAGVPGTYWNYAFHSPSDPSWWPDTSDHLSIVISPGFVQNNVQMPILLKHNTASPQ